MGSFVTRQAVCCSTSNCQWCRLTGLGFFFDGRHALLSRSPADSYLLRNVPGDAAAYLAIATKIIVQETSPEGVRRYTAQCLFENDIPALRALR